ncbi:hypothetical protein [Anaerosporobacter sp.]|uniref:hypothetical protein n=1 Tax=Anaerosporobacter sp. TaxID=1872529 RepID=UPI00286F14D8|nr:hypothetical protein [Anaerosporobacter sp.]
MKKSYTHLEYEYAIKIRKPVFTVVLSDSLLHKKAYEDSSMQYFETTNISLYEEFKAIVLSKMVRFINDIKDIRIAVLSSLYDFSKNPSILGWVREISSITQTTIHKCYKCGKEELLPLKPDFNEDEGLDILIKINRWHKINVDRPGYGSGLDSMNVDFELCDECLATFVDSLVLKKLIYGDEYWDSIEEDFVDVEN